jgi:hypothetical protein
MRRIATIKDNDKLQKSWAVFKQVQREVEKISDEI